MNKEKLLRAILALQTDCGMLKSVIYSVRKSPLPEVRACLPQIKSAFDRLDNVNLDKYFNSEIK